MSATSTPRRKVTFPDSLTNLNRFRKTTHGHNGSSRIVMVRKTDQRTFASAEKGQEPKLETITRETIETFRGERTECKITTEKTNIEDTIPPSLIASLHHPKPSKPTPKKRPTMDFQHQCLTAHNAYRQLHGVPPLQLDKEITKVAQAWANSLIAKKTLQHSNNASYGENLFCISSTDPGLSVAGKDAVDAWYDEIKVHVFGKEPASLESGHFTQVVWKGSRKLGVAMAKQGGRVVVVANYEPPGNYIGRFAENVPPLVTNNNNNVNNVNKGVQDVTHKLKALHVEGSTEGNFTDDFLAAHNSYRARHGVPPLKLDKKLCKYSEEWAKHLASTSKLEHRPQSNYGENIYCMSSSDPNFTITGHTPVDAWYEEVHKHNFTREPDSLGTGHFTQVVWKSSELVGVGVAKSNNTVYVVANYSPAGNFVGDYMDNVPAPLKGAPAPSKSTPAPLRNESSASQPAGEFGAFALEGLKVHNEYRRRHGAPDLKLNRAMCDFAQAWADACAKSASMSHRPDNPYGENVFCVYSSDFSHVPSARDAVKEWYDEVKKFTFGSETIHHGCLHFTQVVWKGCKELGFAMAKNDKGQTYVVANYDPKGNYRGQFVENVKRSRI